MKPFNNFCGTAIIPLLARIVLCAAFITAGWNKLMYVDEFTGEQAEMLIERGVDDVIRVMEPANVQDNAALDEAAANASANDVDHAEPTVEDIENGERILIAKRLHHVTLILIAAGCEERWPVRLAWLLAITEFIGGALLLIGLFSRVWSLALAIAMLGALWWTSVPLMGELGGPFAIAEDVHAFHAMYAQLGLLVLALTVLLAGPGPVSLDRMIFKSHRRHPYPPPPYHYDYAPRRDDVTAKQNTGNIPVE